MPKVDLQKHTLNLRSGDWDYITARFHPKGKDTSTVIRSIVSKFVDAIRSYDDEATIEVDLDL